MDNIWQRGRDYVAESIYPFTFNHLIYFILFTVVTTYITDYFLNYKLFKWIYFASAFVIIINIYNNGNPKAAAVDAFKLAYV